MNSAQGGMVTADNRDLNQPRDQQRAYWNDSRSWEECLRIGHLMASGGAAHRQRCSRTERSDALLRLDQRALSGRFEG